MARLIWDQISEHFYETGVDRGVMYPQSSSGTYPMGHAWNGLSKVSESPSGAEATAVYANNKKYLNLVSAEEYGGTIEAYTYPDAFAECDGSKKVADGLYAGQQTRKAFGFCYRTILGNDTELDDYGYKLHLVYNALVSPSSKEHSTVNDSPEAVNMSWEFKTTALEVEGIRPVSTFEVDSTKTDPVKLAALEDILYGTENTDPRLPLPAEVISILGGSVTPGIRLNTSVVTIPEDGTATLVATTVPSDAVVTWSTRDGDVATVADGVVTGVAAGDTVIEATITVDNVDYVATCTVIVTAA